MGGGGQPAVPDYVGAAQQTGQQNLAYLQAQTQANRPNQTNPTGTSTWSQDASGNWTQNTQLSPQMQGLWNQYIGNTGQAAGAAGGLLSQYQGNNQALSGIQSNILNESTAINPQSAQAAFMSQMQPQLTQQQNATQANLAAQGITPGSVAYNQSQNILSQNQNNAEAQSIMNSGAWANQQQQNLATQFQIANALRTQPLSDYETLMSGTQVSQPSFSNFTNAGVAQAPNLVGAEQAQYGAQVGQANATTASDQAMGSAAGMAVGAAAGSVIPGIGTIAGAGVGGALGGLFGGLF